MTRTIVRIPLPARVGAATVLAAIGLSVAMLTLGVVPVLAVALGLVLLPLLMMRAEAAASVVLVPAVLFEGTAGQLGGAPAFYQSLPVHSTPLEVLLVIALIAVLISSRQGARLRWPGPLTGPLVVLILATVSGMVIGVLNGVDKGLMLTSARTLLYLALVPLVVVNVWRTPRQIRHLLTAAAALIILKSALGIVSLRTGQSFQLQGTKFTYYEPVVNFLCMGYILFVLAAVLRRVRLPWWVLAGTVVVLMSLVLAYRRSFWIAAVLGFVLVLVMASGQTGRPLLLLACAVIGVAVYLTVVQGVVTEPQASGPLARRLASLNPNKLTTNPDDRYRLDERRNVLAELRDQPITGLGLANPWHARYPLPAEHVGGHDYVHFAALWFWLKLGLIGLIGYGALMIGAVSAARRVWIAHADPLLRSLGLAIGVTIVGLFVVETTATFTGANPRFTVIFGAVLGVLASVHLSLRDAAEGGG
ncbi:MAG TPA: O-antigen ligase family protein [Solirubrobacteraceae bacterium]|nr:O-antigen ligase family protein [Solirubrobacteraceae bacterium]